MAFDWTINLGNVLTLVIMMIGGFTFIWSMRTDVLLISQRLNSVERLLDKLAEVSTAATKMESRLNVLDERLTTMSARVENINTRTDNLSGKIDTRLFNMPQRRYPGEREEQ